MIDRGKMLPSGSPGLPSLNLSQRDWLAGIYMAGMLGNPSNAFVAKEGGAIYWSTTREAYLLGLSYRLADMTIAQMREDEKEKTSP